MSFHIFLLELKDTLNKEGFNKVFFVFDNAVTHKNKWLKDKVRGKLEILYLPAF